MSLSFENKLKMLKAVQYTLLTNSDITSSFASEVGRYDEYLQKIRELSQKINYMGQTPTDLEDSIRQASYKMAAAIRGYAAMTNRTDLLTNEHLKNKSIEKSSGDDLLHNCLRILEKVKEYQVSLSLFGVSDNKVSDYENMLFYFSKLKDRGSSVSEGDVVNVCEEAVRFLEETIDTLVEHEKNSFPKFYNEYKYARTTTAEEQPHNLYFFA